jgi:hypothetical protein
LEKKKSKEFAKQLETENITKMMQIIDMTNSEINRLSEEFHIIILKKKWQTESSIKVQQWGVTHPGTVDLKDKVLVSLGLF